MKFDINLHIIEQGIVNDNALIIGKLKVLEQQGRSIMSKLSDFLDEQDEYNNKMQVTLVNISNDIKRLNGIIEKLQASQGGMSDEDLALLSRAKAKTEALLAQMGAIDDLTPPDSDELPAEPQEPTEPTEPAPAE